MTYNNSKHGNLRNVETSFDIKRVNIASQAGLICLFKKRAKNPDLRFNELILRHRISGQFVSVPDRMVFQQYDKSPTYYEEDEWLLIEEVKGYARPSPHLSSWGFYILPEDAGIGEKFFIPELIEDLLATEFWGTKIAAETAVATWTGEDLVIEPSSYRRVLIG